MITEEILALFLAVVTWFINLLPLANNDFTVKYEGLIDYIYTHFIVLGYYYLPVVTIQWWISRTIPFVLSVIGLRLLADILASFTPIKLPWGKL